MRLLTKISIGAALLFASATAPTEACTRATFIGDSARHVITGRTLDWRTPIPTNLYVMPQGVKRSSFDVPSESIDWVSKYGSVVSVGYDVGTSEGMNEKGLVCSLLYLPGSQYTRDNETRKAMSSSLWAQYILDNFATTQEALDVIKQDLFYVNAPAMPDGSVTCLHMAITDATGYTAIIEYIKGDLSIHEGYQYQVLTNAPPYDQQLAVNEYWKTVGGMHMLPGTNRSYDRFARASFYIHAIPKNSDHQTALAGVFGVIGNCAVPTGISVEGQPEISTTQWRSVSDQTDCTYYFKLTLRPSIVWVDLREFLLTPGSPIMKLDLTDSKREITGDAIKHMKPSKGYTPMYRVDPNFKL